jgi:hypothetical protein
MIAASTLSASSSELKVQLLLHFGHVALPVTMKRMAALPSTISFVVLGGVAAPWVLKKDSAALAENTIGRIRKLAQ